MRILQRVGRNIITSIRYMNIVLIYHICDVIKRMCKYAWSDVSRSWIRFTYSSVARHIGPCICHNSQTYTWNDVIPYKGKMIRVFRRFSHSHEKRMLAFSRTSVRARISAAPTGRISVKFGTVYFYEKSVQTNPNLGKNKNIAQST